MTYQEPLGIDGYNGTLSKTASTLGTNCGMTTGRNGVLVLNDQGGGVMNISHNKVNAILATTTAKAHAPIILEDADDSI